MAKNLLAGLLCALALFCATDRAAARQSAAAGPAGKWIVKADFWGSPLYFQMELKRDGPILTGTFGGDKLTGTTTGSSLHDGLEVYFLAKDDQGGTEQCEAILKDGVITGKMIFTDPGDPGHPETHTFTASPVLERTAQAPQHHEFKPTKFYRQFSALNEPVLRVAPGDTIHTTTVDAGGADENGVKRVLGGNPQTGPFYIESAEPGDTLVVHLNKVRLNRDWAISDDDLVPRAVDTEWSVKMKDAGKSVKWHLDIARGVATVDKPTDHLKNYSVPLRPMLGCIATAPPPAAASPGTGDSGGYGGNMDFNDIIEGVAGFACRNAR